MPTTAVTEQGRDREWMRGRELVFGWQHDIFVSWSSMSTQMYSHTLYVRTLPQKSATAITECLSHRHQHKVSWVKRRELGTEALPCALDKRDLLDDYLAGGTNQSALSSLATLFCCDDFALSFSWGGINTARHTENKEVCPLLSLSHDHPERKQKLEVLMLMMIYKVHWE